MNHIRALIPVAAIVAVALAGCGGDDDSLPETPIGATDEAPAESLSEEEFVDEADGICAEVNAAVGTVDASATDTASAVAQKADLYEGMIDRIRDLGAPDDAELSDFFAAGDALVQAEQDAQLAAERGDDAGVATAEAEASTALSDFQAAAESYGFEECGQGPSAPSVVPTDPGTVIPGTTTPAPPTAPVAPTPVAPTPAPAPPAGPTGGAGTDGGTGGGSTGDGGGSNSGSGGIGPG